MGTAVGRIATAGMKSLLSRARNSGRGSSLSMCSMSRWEYSGIGASHPRPQLVQRAELQLLDGALALAEACRDVADAALVDEALDDDVALVPRELVDQSEQPRALFGALDLGIRRRVGARRFDGRGLTAFPRRACGAVGDSVGGDPNQPRAEWCPAPFEALESGECPMEDLGSQVLCRFATTGTAKGKRVDALEMAIVQIGELRAIPLSSLDQGTIVSVRHQTATGINGEEAKKLRASQPPALFRGGARFLDRRHVRVGTTVVREQRAIVTARRLGLSRRGGSASEAQQ